MKQLDLVLENPGKSSSSAFAVKLHGVLMRLIDAELARKLHEESLRPYSLFTVEKKGGLIFRLSALSEEGYPLIEACRDLNEFHLSGVQSNVKVLQRHVYDDAALEDMFGAIPLGFELTLSSPTTYKQKDNFQNWFSLSPLLTSVADKLRAFEGVDVPNDVLYDIEDVIVITDYELSSVKYHIKRNNVINGFQGKVKFLFTDPTSNESAALITLLRYACYCGIGAKTALGMGGISLTETHD
jgi:CRISPR-associated endoribonuclease Cas6